MVYVQRCIYIQFKLLLVSSSFLPANRLPTTHFSEHCQGRSQEGGPGARGGWGSAPGFGAEPKLIQSSQPVWSRREEPNLSESSLRIARSEPERPEAERSEAAGPEPTQPNWIQTNLGTKR